MSLLDRALAAIGLQRMETSEERAALDMLAYCTLDREEYLHGLRQAVDIAKAGGIEDRKLEAVLHLAAIEMMTPGVEQALHEVGIDTRPWREHEAEARRGS